MPKKKRPLGFQTPSIQIEEEYEEILKQLRKKKANWGKISKSFDDSLTFVSEGTVDIIEKTGAKKEIKHDDLMEVEHRVLFLATSLIQVMIARVGKELSECDERISNIDKELKTLRRGLA